MRDFGGPLAVSLLALACNELLGLEPGVVDGDDGAGGHGAAAGAGLGGAGLVSNSGGTTSAGTSAATGGDSATTGGSAATTGGSSGSDAGRGGSAPGRGGDSAGAGRGEAGDAGSGGGEQCTTTADCVELGLAVPPHLCIQGQCVDITNDDCKTLLGAKEIAERPGGEPYVIGAIAPPIEQNSTPYWALELALREFAMHGPVLIDGVARRPVLLVCGASSVNPNPTPVLRSLDYLVGDLGISNLLMLTTTRTELAAAGQHLWDEEGNGPDVFLFDVGGLGGEVYLVRDNGRMWHLLGDSSKAAWPYRPLVQRVEEQVNPGASRGEADHATKLALLWPPEDDGFTEVVATIVQIVLDINGQPAEYSDNYLNVQTHDQQSRAPLDVARFNPDIVIDFANLWREVQNACLDRNGTAPFVILPTEQLRSPLLVQRVTNFPFLRSRMLGVSHVGPVNTTLLDGYLERFGALSSAPNLDGFWGAGAYDGLYYLIYGAIAGGSGGIKTNAGMQRLITGPVRTIGPDGMNDVLEALRAGSTMSLEGTLGPRNFGGGVSNTWANVWCIDENLEFQMDALRYVPEDRSLQGTFPCFDF